MKELEICETVKQSILDWCDIIPIEIQDKWKKWENESHLWKVIEIRKIWEDALRELCDVIVVKNHAKWWMKGNGEELIEEWVNSKE